MSTFRAYGITLVSKTIARGAKKNMRNAIGCFFIKCQTNCTKDPGNLFIKELAVLIKLLCHIHHIESLFYRTPQQNKTFLQSKLLLS